MRGKRILIVDDDTLVLRSLDMMLQSNGYDTATVESGTEAIRIMREDPFEVVLMDVIMRGMDGIDTLREIRMIAPNTSVILISGYSEPERILEAVRNGAADYIVKPCEEEELVARIETVFQRRRSGAGDGGS